MRIYLLFALLFLYIGFTSAFLETSKDMPSLKENVKLQISESANKYPAIQIKDNLGIPLLSDVKAELVLTEHTEQCSTADCFSIFQITTYQDSALVDSIKFYTLVDDGVTLDEPREQDIRSHSFSYWGNIIDYETQCVDGEEIISENGTSYTPQECQQVEVGSHEGWINFNEGQEFTAGTYQVKLSGEKRPTRSVDWVIETQGKLISEWAVWGGPGNFLLIFNTTTTPAVGSAEHYSVGTALQVKNITVNDYVKNITSEMIYSYGSGGGTGLWTYYYDDGTTQTISNGTSSLSYINISFVNPNQTKYVRNIVLSLYVSYLPVNATITEKNTKVYGGGGFIQLNSPLNNSIVSSNSVTFNASATVTGGTNIINMSLYTNETGSWAVKNTTNSSNTVNFSNTTGYTMTGTMTLWTNFTLGGRYVNSVRVYTQGSGQGHAVSMIIQYNYSNGTVLNVTNASVGGVGLVVLNVTANPLLGSPIQSINVWANATTYNPSFPPLLLNETVVAQNMPLILFNRTYSSASNIKWNVQACDSDGACGFATSNYTFSIDSVAPTIALNYPTSLINYGAINQTLQLNFTATDTNLDKVWYDYNGTNVTIAGATSGVANLSNITLSSKKNVTIYANDTAGNLNTTTFSWDYKVFENSQSYINQTYSRVSNSFSINITSQNISLVKLNYNGTNYSTSSYPSGLNTISSVNILTPVITQDTNVTFYWLFDLLDSSAVQSPSTNQSILYLAIGNNYSNLIYNITIRNEETNDIIPNNNVTMTYEVTYGFDNSSILGIANFNDNKLSNKNISSNVNTSLYLSGNIIYSADLFIGRNYYFIEESISNPKNITLYLSYSNQSFVKTILVTDEAGRGKPALFKQYRVIDGVNTLVASEQLDSTGRSTIAFIPNTQYTFDFEMDGCTDLTKNIIFYDQSDYTQVLSCSSYNPNDYVDPFESMVASFSPDGVFYVDNSTNASDSLFSVDVSGSTSFCSNVNALSFTVYNSAGAVIVNDNSNNCANLSGLGYFNNYATARLDILLDSGDTKVLNYRWIKIFSNSDYSNYSILNLISEVGNSDDILGIDWKVKLLFCFIGLFGVIIALTVYQRLYNLSNVAMLVIIDIYLWVMCFIGWGDINLNAGGSGVTSLVSKYAIFILGVVATAGIIATKEDEYS